MATNEFLDSDFHGGYGAGTGSDISTTGIRTDGILTVDGNATFGGTFTLTGILQVNADQINDSGSAAWITSDGSQNTTLAQDLTVSGNIVGISHGTPRFRYTETGEAADEKVWDQVVDTKILKYQTLTDALGAGEVYLQATRGTGTAITEIKLRTNDTDAITISSAQAVTLTGDLLVNTNTLFVDASNNNVIMGSASAIADANRPRLAVVKSAGNDPTFLARQVATFKHNSTAAQFASIGVIAGNGVGEAGIDLGDEDDPDECRLYYNNSTQAFKIDTAATLALTIDSNQDATFAQDIIVTGKADIAEIERAGNIVLDAQGANAITFFTNGTQRMSIASGGGVALTAGLQVDGNTTLGNASTDLITCTGRLLPRQISDAPPISSNVSQWELFINSADNRVYMDPTGGTPSTTPINVAKHDTAQLKFYDTASASTVTINTISVWEEFNAMEAGLVKNFGDNITAATGANDTITIGTGGAGNYLIHCLTTCTSASGTNQLLSVGVSINDAAPSENLQSQRSVSSTAKGFWSITALESLSAADVLKVEYKNDSGTVDVDVTMVALVVQKVD
jgi:hypothetical protein